MQINTSLQEYKHSITYPAISQSGDIYLHSIVSEIRCVNEAEEERLGGELYYQISIEAASHWEREFLALELRFILWNMIDMFYGQGTPWLKAPLTHKWKKEAVLWDRRAMKASLLGPAAFMDRWGEVPPLMTGTDTYQ